MRRLGVAAVAVAAMLVATSLQTQRATAVSPGWLARSDAACRGAAGERAAVLANVSRVPSRTARRTLLRILTGTAQAESRLLGRLSKVHAPRSATIALARTIALFRARHAEDVRLIARLRRRWNVRLLERQTRRDRAVNARLARLWSRLGSGACARYFRALRS